MIECITLHKENNTIHAAEACTCSEQADNTEDFYNITNGVNVDATNSCVVGYYCARTRILHVLR